MLKVIIPVVDVNDTECEIVKIYFKSGDSIEKGDVLLTIETTKTTEDILAEQSGVILYFCQFGEKIVFNSIAAIIFNNVSEYKDYTVNEFKTTKVENNILKFTKKAEHYIEENRIEIDAIIPHLKNKTVVKTSDIIELLSDKQSKTKLNLKTNFNRKRIVIIGAGTAGEVVADILMDYPEYEIIGFVDDSPRKNFQFYGIKIIYDNVVKFPEYFSRDLYDAVIISFGGDLKNKNFLFQYYTEKKIEFINAIDKTAKIGRNVQIGYGNVIGANTYIGTSSEIGNNNWIAASVNIDHHNNIGDSNLFGPNFTSPGVITIGDMNKFGANSSLNNYVEIGNMNNIVNGTCVFRNIENNQIVKNK